MSIFNKIFTALRGGASEIGESIIDANGIRIFEQEIRDAEKNIHEAKISLTKLMAEQSGAKRKVATLEATISEHELYAGQALEKNNEALAMEIAEKIAEFESELAIEQGAVDTHEKTVMNLRNVVKQQEGVIKSHKRELAMVKTTESVQKATAAASSSLINGSSGLSGAKSSIDRIKAKQQKRADQMDAAKTLENSGNELQDKLKAAGIGASSGSANSVLERLKAKQNK